MADVREILDIEAPAPNEITKEFIISGDKKVRKKYDYNKTPKRPEGMHREVFALLCKDNNEVPPLFPTDTGRAYKQVKAKLGMKKARKWKWTPFTNPARTDNAVFHHWRRVADAAKEYPFAKFNKKIQIPVYTDAEYLQHLVTNNWTRAETDNLFDLCRRFDLRFIVIHDRWDKNKFSQKSVDDLKNRYYQVCAALNKLKSNEKVYVFDLEHEKRRKEQLSKLFDRSQNQIEEEQILINELKKIDQRKKERERKTQDLQKLISAADSQVDPKKTERKTLKKTTNTTRQKLSKIDTTSVLELAGIKFPDIKSYRVSIRSQGMKIPGSLGQKKIKSIETVLTELKLEHNPPATEQISQHFNELRNDILLYQELKSALVQCDFELQSLKHHYEAIAPADKRISIPSSLLTNSSFEVKKEAVSSVSSLNL